MESKKRFMFAYPVGKNRFSKEFKYNVSMRFFLVTLKRPLTNGFTVVLLVGYTFFAFRGFTLIVVHEGGQNTSAHNTGGTNIIRSSKGFSQCQGTKPSRKQGFGR